MKRQSFGAKRICVGLLIAAFCLSGLPTPGQDLVPVSDISGGSSVFVFKNSSKAAPRRYTTATTRPTRTKAQRLEVATKIKKQYEAKSTSDPGREKSTVVEPSQIAKSASMPKGQGSKLFAGVGEYYLDRGMLDEAIESFNEALSLDGKNVAAHTGLSDVLARKGNDLLIVKDQPTQAKGYFQDALAQNPKNAAAYFGLGSLYADLDQDVQAITNYEKALQYDKNLTEIYAPLGIAYYENGDIAKADDMLTKALANSDGAAETQYFLGLIRYSQNRNEEALSAFQKSQTLDPTNADAFFRAGETFTRLKRSNEAIAAYQRATSLKPNYFEAHLGIAVTSFELEKYPDAIKAYKSAIKYKNDNAEIFAGLADAYRLNGDWADAEANYNLATLFMSRVPNFNKDEAADIYNKISYVIARQCEIDRQKNVQCKWPLAVAALEKAVALSGKQTDYANLGWAYYNYARMDIDFGQLELARPKLELAKTNLQKALGGNPAIVDGVLQNLGAVQIDLGDFAGAIESLKPVVERRKDWNFSKYALATAYYKVDDFENSAKWFHSAVDSDPDYLAAIKSLGYAELKRRNAKEVKKVIDRLKKLSPRDAASLEFAMKAAKLD